MAIDLLLVNFGAMTQNPKKMRTMYLFYLGSPTTNSAKSEQAER